MIFTPVLVGYCCSMIYTITPLIAEETIDSRVRELAAAIDEDFGNQPYLILLLLEGAVPFGSLLSRYLKTMPEVRTVKVSSYDGMESSGSLIWHDDCGELIPDLPVLVVDDVLDTGRTLSAICRELKSKGVSRVCTAVAVDKHCCRKVPFEADYVAFKQGDTFLVGFGMDLNQLHRDLPYIGQVELERT